MTDLDQPPVVSLVVAAFNSESTIGRTIESVIAQTEPRWELIVVDDGSTDDTVGAAVAAADRDPRVVVIRSDHGGVSIARNHGIAVSRGGQIGFIDSDDTISPDWTRSLLRPFEENPEVGIAFCAVTFEEPEGTRTVVEPGVLGPLHRNTVGLFLAGSFLIDRHVLDESGGYAESLTFGENYELGIRVIAVLASRGLLATVVSQPLAEIASNPERAFSRAKARAAYARYLVSTHAELMEKHPDTHHSLLRQIAVNNTRVAESAAARRAAIEAAMIAPRRLSSWTTLAGAAIPPLGRAGWGSINADGSVRRPRRLARRH